MQLSVAGTDTDFESTANRVEIFIAWRPINHHPQNRKAPSHSGTPATPGFFTCSSRRYRRGNAATPLLHPRVLSGCWLEVVILDVLCGELQRLTSDDLSGRVDCIFTRPLAVLNRKGVASLPLNLSLGEILRRIVRDISKFDGIPQVESFDRAIKHIFAGDTRHAIAGDFNRTGLVNGLESPRDRRNTRASLRNDPCNIRILCDQCNGRIESLLFVIVSLHLVHTFDILVLFKFVAEYGNP